MKHFLHNVIKYSAIRFDLKIKLTAFLAVTFACVFISFSVSGESKKTTIGHATVVIGSSYVQKNGNKTTISRGTTFKVGDEIVTRSNGHVHIRFDDKGILSVRPNSKLIIEKYHYDIQNPSKSTVKFNLVKGVARSVSGKAAKAARSRFRMNTPIAAIGVRGTDFVISANSEVIKAFVNEGTIVVSPFSPRCLAATLGPCVSDAVELHGDTNKLLELRNQQSIPTVRSIKNETLPAFLYSDKKQEDAVEKTSEGDAVEKTSEGDTVTTVVSTQVLGMEDNSQSSNRNVISQEETEAASIVEIDTAVLPDPALESTIATSALGVDLSTELSNTTDLLYITPIQSIDSDELTKRQLVWGRWSEGNSANDIISTSYKEASKGRVISVGDASQALFREGDRTQSLATNLGNVSFDLHFADVDYFTANGYSQMTVDDGFLNINFNEKVFSTGLTLDHNNTGNVNFRASGSILDNGLFLHKSDTKSLSGAVSFDGSEAGYLFSESLENGTIKGSTLWGKP
jgi:hypothetical protein